MRNAAKTKQKRIAELDEFTVSAAVRDAVREIYRQSGGVRLKSLREEFTDLLEKADIEYDPRYLD